MPWYLVKFRDSFTFTSISLSMPVEQGPEISGAEWKRCQSCDKILLENEGLGMQGRTQLVRESL
jgi:hypothetical protein